VHLAVTDAFLKTLVTNGPHFSFVSKSCGAHELYKNRRQRDRAERVLE